MRNPVLYSTRLLSGFSQTLTPISLTPISLDDPKQRQPNIELAREVLAWEPKVGLEEGLKMTIQYFQEILLG
jgi:UDP-glucuronate decarboxylase